MVRKYTHHFYIIQKSVYVIKCLSVMSIRANDSVSEKANVAHRLSGQGTN